jgi:hypothetical protein
MAVPKQKAKTLAEVSDNIAARQMGFKEQAAVARKDATEVNKKIHKAGGETALLDRLSEGETILSLARSLEISHSSFYDWIERGGEERASALARARARGGRSLAEQTIDIADNATIQEAQLAKLRVDTRRWLACKQAPDEQGDMQQPLGIIDLGSLALDALRKRSIMSTE